MRLSHVLATAVAAFFAGTASASDFYVNGAIGTDGPGNGTSDTPYKTIAYALQQVPTTGTHTVHVAGGQIYSAGTNGEVFPLLLSSNIALVGVGRPVLDVPALGIGIHLDPATNYDYGVSRIENFELLGGARGIDLGAQEGFEHSLRIHDCWFSGQTDAGVRIEPEHVSEVGVSTHHVRVWQCHFEQAKHGVFANTTTQFAGETQNGQSITVEVPESSFRDLTGTGVRIEHLDSVDFAEIKFHVVSCSFQRCNQGVAHIVETAEENNGAFNEIVTFVRHCEFMETHGIFSLVAHFPPPLGGSPMPRIVVENCVFGSGADKTAISGQGIEGAYQLIARHNAISGFEQGIDLDLAVDHAAASPDVLATLEANEIHDTDIGISLSGDPSSDWTVTASRSRTLGNRVGAEVLGLSPSSRVTMSSNMFVKGTDGLVLDTSAEVTARGLTIADNADHGLIANGYGSSSSFSNIMFAGNGAEATVIGALPIEYSFFETMIYPGVGNVDSGDPQLMRPSYKLAATSPCREAGNPNTPPEIDYEGDPRPLQGVWDIGADEYSPTGSLRTFGVPGWGKFVFHPGIGSSQSSAVVGGTLGIELRQAIDSRRNVADAAYLLVGTRDDRSIALPGSPGSHLWIDVVGFAGPMTVDPDGSQSVQITVPPAPEIVGLPVTFQWLLLKPNANERGVVTTDALRVTLGS